MTKNTSEKLETKIERLVREHLAEQQAAALVAVQRGFATVMSDRRQARAGAGRAGYTRRASTEVAEVAQRLLEAVQACPGETMTVLAARVGMKAGTLHRPMMHLKTAGRVRSAGERSRTRYFPMAAGKSA